jgi:nickel-dependent lactate racemase
MVKAINIPWGAWYEEEEIHTLEFPDSWNIEIFNMNGSDSIINREDIANAIKNPIGSPPLQEIAEGKKTAVIVFEDISRPTKCEPICELIVKELNSAGIRDENITLIAAIGAHRPLNTIDLIKKIGKGMVDRFNIENHHPYENLVELGKSNRGTPIHLNKTYYEADIKIAISTVIPHPLAGFGGGAKIILPGISGIETLAANHKAALEGKGVGIGFITDLRKDIEDVCQRVGLDFSINIIAKDNREMAGVFAGDFIDAHRKAIEYGKEVYQTHIPKLKDEADKFDIGTFNLFPEDSELSQSSKGTNLFMQAENVLKEEAVVIFTTASPEGRGYHSLLGESGAKLYDQWKEAEEIFMEFCEEKTFALFSPNLNRFDVNHYWSEHMLFSQSFSELIASSEIRQKLPETPKVAIFPTSIQLLI